MRILAAHLQAFVEYAYVRNLQNMLGSVLEEDLTQPDATVTTSEFYRILDEIHSELQDEELGLRTGRFFNLNALGLIYQISMQAATIAEGIFYLKSFLSSTLPIIKVFEKSSVKRTRLQLSIEEGEPKLNRIILEAVLIIISRELSMMCSADAEIRCTSPYFSASYPEFFFKANSFSIEFSNVNLKAAIRNYGNQQLNYLIPQYLKLIAGLKNEQTFINRVKVAMLNLAKPALPALRDTASNFNLTERTFQRYLARENYTYTQIVEELNKEIASLLLKHDGYKIADISYLLGYSEPASFTHSYNKWFGHPPTANRYK